MVSSILTSPLLISPACGFDATNSIACLPSAMRIRVSTSAGPAVSRMTSSIPQSALTAVNPPSVVIAIIGQPTPVE